MDIFFYNTDKSFTRQEQPNSRLKIVPYSSFENSQTFNVHVKDDEGWSMGSQVEMMGNHINEFDVVRAFSQQSNTQYLDKADIQDLIEEGDLAGEKWSLIRGAQQGDTFGVATALKEESHEQSTIQAALTWASQEGHHDIVKMTIDCLDPTHDSKEALAFSMERAIASRHQDVAQTLMEHVDLTQDDSLYLRMACYTEQTDLAKALLDGSNAQDAMTRLVKDNKDMKAMMASDEGGYESGIEVLSSISTVTAQSHVFTDEMVAMGEAGDTYSIKGLLAKGANPQDAIYEASLFGHQDTVEALVLAGASADDGLSASTVTNQQSVFKYLLPQASQEGVDRALVNAADHGQVAMTKDLLDNGADPHIKNNLAFRVAISSNRQEVLNTLASYTDDVSSVRADYHLEEHALDMLDEAEQYTQTRPRQRSSSYQQ